MAAAVSYIPHARVHLVSRTNRFESTQGMCPALWVETIVPPFPSGDSYGLYYQCQRPECHYNGWG